MKPNASYLPRCASVTKTGTKTIYHISAPPLPTYCEVERRAKHQTPLHRTFHLTTHPPPSDQVVIQNRLSLKSSTNHAVAHPNSADYLRHP